MEPGERQDASDEFLVFGPTEGGLSSVGSGGTNLNTDVLLRGWVTGEDIDFSLSAVPMAKEDLPTECSEMGGDGFFRGVGMWGKERLNHATQCDR